MLLLRSLNADGRYFVRTANEPICVARKPLEGTVAENVLKYGCGGLNIDGCRIGFEDTPNAATNPKFRTENNYKHDKSNKDVGSGIFSTSKNLQNTTGRFPANVILDEYMGAELDKQSGITKSGGANGNRRGHGPSFGDNCYGEYKGLNTTDGREPDEGGASRFFYCPKPDNFERNKGLKNFPKTSVNHIASETGGGGWKADANKNPNLPRANHHPTVKPIDLMRYLVKLVTPKGGICLDPFCGSGTTLIAAKMELMNYIGIDMDESHIPLAEARIKNWNPDLYKPQELFD